MSLPSIEDAELVGYYIGELAVKKPIHFLIGCGINLFFLYYVFK